jgi:hypothetical protein
MEGIWLAAIILWDPWGSFEQVPKPQTENIIGSYMGMDQYLLIPFLVG